MADGADSEIGGLLLVEDETLVGDEISVTPTPTSAKYQLSITSTSDDEPNPTVEKYCNVDEEIVKFTPIFPTSESGNYEGDDDDEDEDDDDDDDDDTLSSEAMVDDIELILMPEETLDLPESQSPKLVRVRELTLDETGHFVEDDEDDDCNFRKMDASERSERRGYVGGGQHTDDDEDEDDDDEDEGIPTDEVEGAVGYSSSKYQFSSTSTAGLDDEDLSYASSTTSDRRSGRYARKSIASSSAQTEISALEVKGHHHQPIIFDYRSGRKVMTSSTGKRLNWKSEITLFPSKNKHGMVMGGTGGLMDLGGGGHFIGGGTLRHGNEDESRDYGTGCRVTKFTSQDNVLGSSSQFLKPSTLYRTRNLSRNLNQLGSSETSFLFPSEPETNKWHNYSKGQSGNNLQYGAKRLPTTSAKSFRSSLPDLSPGLLLPDGTTTKYTNTTRRRQSHQYTATSSSSSTRQLRQSMSGCGLRKYRKKSSSDEETSSLIDESERCLRSSIDLLLMDDYPPPPGYDFPYYPHGGSSSNLGRKYSSQPLLTEETFFYRGEPRNKGMGSPFLPRRMSDLRCSKYAKVILPDGQVSVVSIMEIDEIRETLKVMTSGGSNYIIPFRKVVFAWRNTRR